MFSIVCSIMCSTMGSIMCSITSCIGSPLEKVPSSHATVSESAVWRAVARCLRDAQSISIFVRRAPRRVVWKPVTDLAWQVSPALSASVRRFTSIPGFSSGSHTILIPRKM